MGILDRVAGVAPTRTRRGQFQSLARLVETASDWNGNGRYLERRRWCLVRSGQPIKNQSRLVKEGASGAVCLLTVGRRWTADGEAALLVVRTYLHGGYAQHYCRYSLGPLQEQLTQSCTHSQAPRQFKKQHITQSSVTIAYIHYSSQRASPPPRCTCAHVSQISSPRYVVSSSCRSVHLPCTRLPGPVGSLATMRRFLGGT